MALGQEGARGIPFAAEGVDRAEHPVGHQRVVRGGAGNLQLRAELGRPVPVAELAQHVGHAAEAHLLHALGPARLAEADRRGERVARAAVVAGDLVGRSQALVDLGGRERELVLEREREPRPDGLQAGLEIPALHPGDALEPQRPRPQVGALGAGRLLAGDLHELHGLGVLARALQEGRRPDPLGGCLAGQAVRGEGLGRDAPGGERALAVALEAVDRRQRPLGVGEGAAGALGPPHRHHLALRARRLGQLARHLGEVRVALQDVDPLGGALALRPQVERLPAEARGVAVGVDRGALLDRQHQRVERAGAVLRGEPVRGHLGVAELAVLQRLGQPAVERAPAKPRHVLVDRVARERVAEGGAAGLDLEDQPARQQLVEARLAAEVRHQLDVELDARHRGGLRGRAGRGGEVAGA